MQRLHQIAIAEQTDLTQEVSLSSHLLNSLPQSQAFDELLDISEGDLRVAVMVLQSCSSLFDPKQRKPLTAEIVQSVAGVSSMIFLNTKIYKIGTPSYVT